MEPDSDSYFLQQNGDSIHFDTCNKGKQQFRCERFLQPGQAGFPEERCNTRREIRFLIRYRGLINQSPVYSGAWSCVFRAG
jgi:hypothetical protein